MSKELIEAFKGFRKEDSVAADKQKHEANLEKEQNIERSIRTTEFQMAEREDDMFQNVSGLAAKAAQMFSGGNHHTKAAFQALGTLGLIFSAATMYGKHQKYSQNALEGLENERTSLAEVKKNIETRESLDNNSANSPRPPSGLRLTGTMS